MIRYKRCAYGGACSIFAFTIAVVALAATAACRPVTRSAGVNENTREITNFAVLFKSNCEGCHGVDGHYGPARPLNDAVYLAIVPKAELAKVITYGRPGTAMPAWAVSQGGPLTDRQVQALVNGMEQNWAKPVNFGGATPPSYAQPAGETGDADAGKKLFGRDCFACHGPGAPIGPVADPTYLQLASNQLLRTAIIEGRPDWGMPDYRTLNLGHALADQDITNLVAYLVSKRPVSPNVQNMNTNTNGTGQTGPQTTGNEGSGNGPGSPSKHGQQPQQHNMGGIR